MCMPNCLDVWLDLNTWEPYPASAHAWSFLITLSPTTHYVPTLSPSRCLRYRVCGRQSRDDCWICGSLGESCGCDWRRIRGALVPVGPDRDSQVQHVKLKQSISYWSITSSRNSCCTRCATCASNLNYCDTPNYSILSYNNLTYSLHNRITNISLVFVMFLFFNPFVISNVFFSSNSPQQSNCSQVIGFIFSKIN